MPTSKRVVVSFAALFFSAVSGLVVCFMLSSMPAPWSFDDTTNARIVGLPHNETFSAWVARLDRSEAKGLDEFLRMLYKALLVSVAANCVFVLCVIFFASTNHALVLSTQAGTCLTMILVAQCVPSLHENSVHFRLYISVLVTNSIGLVMHLWQQLFQRAEAAASATHSKQQPELTACNKSALTPPVPATASTATTESSVSDEASKKQD